MSRKTANGAQAYADGQDTVDLWLNLIGPAVTLTSQASADNFFNASNANIWKVDLRGCSQVRLTGRVTTVSASANSPRIQLRYSSSFTTTIGSFLQLGASSVEFSMFTGATLGDSGWINLVPGAQQNDEFLALTMIGGDASASPVVANIMAHFR